MSIGGFMLVHFLLLIAVSYAIFVFMTDVFNPFCAVNGLLKRRIWRLARSVALASLVAGTLTLIMLDSPGSVTRSALATYLALVGLFVTPSVIQYRNSSIWR